MKISTHVLDVADGSPAPGIDVTLRERSENGWIEVGKGTTDTDGRVGSLLDTELTSGTYQVTFATGPYHQARGIDPFFPEVTVTFQVPDANSHYHVPLLLSPFGYTTYRGS